MAGAQRRTKPLARFQPNLWSRTIQGNFKRCEERLCSGNAWGKPLGKCDRCESLVAIVEKDTRQEPSKEENKKQQLQMEGGNEKK